MGFSILLGVIAIILIIEGCFVFFFPKTSKSLMRKFLKIKDLKKAGLIEFVIGIVLLLIAIMLKGS